jgi:hypothetical protein
MTINKSIIIKLDNDLKIFEINHTDQKISKIFDLKPTQRILNLNDDFFEIWQSLWSKHLETANNFYYFVGSKSSFTNTRIIYLWLKSNFEFMNKDFFVEQDSMFDPELQPFDFVQIKLQSLSSNDLVYSAKPKIGIQ